jgi:alkylation response protein AidB-like acyl-CoA dehydrogenase
MSPAVPSAFDRHAGRYDTHATVQREAAAWLAEWLPQIIDGHALELGAGTGLFTRHLATRATQLVATDTAMKVTTQAIQVHGGYGYTQDFPVERYFREAKVLQIVEGTNQIQRMVIGRSLLANP